MKDFVTKIDDDATDAGVVVAEEYNSIFKENKNAVATFLTLNGADDKQMQKAIDIAIKAMFYTDAGTPNSVVLSRSATTETTETLFDGMVIFFAPANANTGATTLKVNTLVAKDLKYNGLALTAGFLETDSKYIAIYSVANNRFDCDLMVSYKNLLDNKSATWVANDSRAKTALNAGGTAPIFACRAWLNFKGTGVIAIRASGNISSIVDDGTGKYIVNFIETMDDADYSIGALYKRDADISIGGIGVAYDVTPTVSSFSVRSFDSSNASLDMDAVYIQIQGN